MPGPWRLVGTVLLGTLPLHAPSMAAETAPGHAWAIDSQRVFVRLPAIETAAVGAIAQDRQGFLWFGTQSNLLRWDGYSLHAYAQDPDVPGSLPDNFIRSLLVDERGQLWVGTNSGGLARYDTATDGFTAIPVGDAGTRDGTVMALVSDRQGGLWIGTGHGIDHLNGATGRVDLPRIAGPKGAVPALLLDRDGALWAGTRSGLLRRARGETQFQPYPLPTPDGTAAIVNALLQDSAGRIWIGATLVGAFIVDPGADHARRLLDAPASARPINETVSSLRETADGHVWLGTAESGVLRVDTRTWRTTRDQREAARSHSLPSNQVDALYADRAGTLWVGTRAALGRTDPRQDLIQTYYGGNAPGLQLDDETVSAVLATPDGRVWLALGGGGVEVLDPAVGRVARLRSDPENVEHALPKNQVITMARTADGSVLMGTSGGLYRTGADARAAERVGIASLPRALDVRALVVAGDRVWLGSIDGLKELATLPGGGLALRRQWDHELGDPRVRTLVRDRDGGLWIGTPTGVSHLDPASGDVVRLASDPKDAHALPGGYISSMLTDRRGRLWVATFGRGVQVEQSHDAQGHWRFRRLTQRDGLPQNSVDALLQDMDGAIWASTDGGLARIDPDSLQVRAFRADDGVGIDGFFTGEADMLPSGDLVFGGLNGMVVVHPANAAHAPEAPLVLTDVHTGNEAVAPSAALLHDGLQVSAHDRALSVEFAALDYAEPGLRRFAYRLQGFDAGWKETPASRRLAAYTNLPAGDYVLQLRSGTSEEAWSVPLELPVHVQAAWYEWGLVRAAGVLALLAAVAAVVNLRTVVLRRRHAELERVVAERTAQLKRSQEYLEKMAYFDALTGLPNRRMFSDHLRRLIAGHERDHGSFVVLLLDLDGFKAVNDTFGHDVGDKVLESVGQALQGQVRETDLAARLGGDEFGVVLAQPRDRAAVEATCARIVRRLREPIGVQDHCVVIGVSIGIAGVPADGATPDELYKAADAALYEAKTQGRNTWRWDPRSENMNFGAQAVTGPVTAQPA